MEINLSGLPDKTEPKTPTIDLSGLPDKEISPSLPSTGPQWVQGEGVTIGHKISEFFSNFKNPEQATSEATQALVDSEALGISPGAAMRLRYPIDQGIKINPKAAELRSTKMQRINQSIDIGQKTNQKGLIGFEALMTGDSALHEKMNAITLPTAEETYIPESGVEGAFRQAAEMAPMMVSSALEATPTALTTSALFAMASGIFLGPEAMPAGWTTGMAVGGGAGAFKASMKREAGLAYADISNMKDKQGNPIDQRVARAAALGIGVINGALEVGQLKVLFESVPGLDKLFSKAIMDTVKSKFIKERLADVAFKYGQNITLETLQEVGQESSNVIFEEIAKKVTNNLKGTDFEPEKVEEVFNRLKETAVQSAKAFSVMMAPGASMNVAKEAMPAKKEKPTTPIPAPVKSPVKITNVTRDETGEIQSYDLKDNRGNKYKGIAPEDVPSIFSQVISKTESTDLDTEIDRIFSDEQSFNDFFENTASTMPSDALLEGEQGNVSGEAIQTQQEETAQSERSIVDNIKAINDIIGNKGSIDFESSKTPLVDLGKTIWNEGAQSLESFTTRAKELLGDTWDKVKDFITQVWEQVKAFNEKLGERGNVSGKKIKSLFAEVVDRGGLDPDKLKQNREWNEDVIENGLLGLTKTGGQGLDDIAGQLQSEGRIGPTPNEYAGPEDYLLALLRDEMTGKPKVSEKKLKAEQEKINQEAEQFINKESFKEGKKAGQKQEREKAKETIENETIRLKREYREATETAIKKNRSEFRNEIAELMKENEWVREAFKTAERTGRQAFREGNKQGVEEQKAVIKKMLGRRSLVKNVRDYFGLSDDDLKKISRKNPLLMDDIEFHNYMKDIEELSVYYLEKAQAKFELMLKIESKRLKKWENYREAMGLPIVNEMTPQQMNDFADLLEPYQEDDTFLGKREIETVDNTDLKGIRTWREAREKLAQEMGVAEADLATVNVGALDYFRWDESLRERNPFYDLLVTKMMESMLGGDTQFHNIETKAIKLAKKADKSHGRSLADRAVPTDEKIMMFLESPEDTRDMIARGMTPEQLDYAHFMQQYFANALDYLLTVKALERGRENYFVHIRKTFLENAKERGIVTAFKEMFKNFEEDQAVFKILDDATGEILPLEKFFQFALHRTGALDPTTNVTKAFLQYARTFERKKMFDNIIPKMDIYAQSLTPETYTERGLETDRTLKKFVYQYVNNKKGRKMSFDGAVKQGGVVDMAIRGLRTFTTILDLGLSPISQTATFIGEQGATAVMLGPKQITKATARIKTAKGQRILEKYEVFTGRSFWEKFTAPGKEVTERLTETLFAGFHISSVLANKQFLLGSLTEQEWNNEEISNERLSEMKLDMGRFRPVPGTDSLVGSTSIGNAVVQYKGWAVAMTRSVAVDIGRFAKDLKNKPIGEALTTREAKELSRIVGITAAALIVGSMAGADEKDKSFVGKLKYRAHKEAMSLTAGMNPAFWFSTPRLLTWLYQTGVALGHIATLEKYKTKPGLKGTNELYKQVMPRTVRQLTEEDKKGGR